MKIELHMFSNCTPSSPSTEVIRKTYASFCETFGAMSATVWCDPNPRPAHFAKYRSNLLKNFKVVNKCTSLSDGYIKAIESSTADFLFMLEHDWLFRRDLVKHGLDDIIEEMKASGIFHFRFNKRPTVIAGWDKELHQMEGFCLTWCKTHILSNNPHIIDRKKYLGFIRKKYIAVQPGSKGIEERISKMPDTWGAIYGPMGYPATVDHIDGRRRK